MIHIFDLREDTGSMDPRQQEKHCRKCLPNWIGGGYHLGLLRHRKVPPEGSREHSTRSVATSCALSQGVTVEDGSAAASWATSHTFVRFYSLDIYLTESPAAFQF